MTRRRMIVMDVDSTFIQQEQLDLLAEEVGAGEYVSAITQRMGRGEIEFAQSLRLRTKPLAGLDISVLDRVRAKMTLTPGAQELLNYAQERDWPAHLVSGGFHDLLDEFVADLSIAAVYANRLEIEGRRLTGNVQEPIIGRGGKAERLRALADSEHIALQDVIAIGDGANDIGMVTAAGLGVAFSASKALRDAADLVLGGPRLDALIPLLDE